MPSERSIIGEIGRALWDIGAVHLRFDSPVRLPHASPSPIFIDTRQIFSRVALRRHVVAALVAMVRHRCGAEHLDLVVGDETALKAAR